MSEPTIVCPNCQHEMKLTESLAAPLLQQTRHQFEQRLASKDREILAREAAVKEQQEAVAREKAAVAEQVAATLHAEREKVAAEEARKARLALNADLEQRARELKDLQQILAEKDAKLGEAQKVQAELLKKQRELDDAKRELDLSVEKKVQEQLLAVRDKARQEAEDSLKLKVTEKEEQIASMQRQIEDLRRKAEQGSQQLQGEAFELELETVLRAKFPRDLIEPVPKGEFGGDVLHRVMGPAARFAARSSGRRSGRRTGAMAGSASSARTSARHVPRLRCSSPTRYRKASRPSTRSTASGSPSRAAWCPWRSRCARH